MTDDPQIGATNRKKSSNITAQMRIVCCLSVNDTDGFLGGGSLRIL